MSNLQTLADAFAELERRADAAVANPQAELTLPAPVRHRARVPLVAASVLTVGAIAAGAALLARGGGGQTETVSPMSGSTHTAVVPRTFHIPRTPAELAARFRFVLGATATFTVTDTGAAVTATAPPAPTGSVSYTRNQPTSSSAPQTNGAAIVGTLSAGGVTGGFDLQIFQAGRHEKAQCDDPDRSRCTVRALADGSSLAVGHEPLEGAPSSVTYQVTLIRPDGVEFLMHVSNQLSPKGASRLLAAHPPLTTRQMTQIVTSDRW